MKVSPQVNAASEHLLNLFREPGKLPAVMANVYLLPVPQGATWGKWSISNRLLMRCADTQDARGFRQWQEAGRQVKKGSKAFHILAPNTRKITDKATGETRVAVIGFRAVPIFRIEDTDGPALETQDTTKFIDALPLVDVARAWGIDVSIIPGCEGGYSGYYAHGPNTRKIALAVENLSTWAHELMHAADHKAGTMVEKKPQHWRKEVVAEFGGAVLLTMLGYKEQADTGGAYRYVEHYAKDANITPVQAAMKCIDRIDKAITLILDQSVALAAQPAQVA